MKAIIITQTDRKIVIAIHIDGMALDDCIVTFEADRLSFMRGDALKLATMLEKNWTLSQ